MCDVCIKYFESIMIEKDNAKLVQSLSGLAFHIAKDEMYDKLDENSVPLVKIKELHALVVSLEKAERFANMLCR